MSTTFAPICMLEEYWADSQFSIVRYTGMIKIGDHEYIIVNKEGKDIFQCSIEAEKAGREKAIEPGEPADLVRCDFVMFYHALGRERFLDVLRKNRQTSSNNLKKIYQNIIDPDHANTDH